MDMLIALENFFLMDVLMKVFVELVDVQQMMDAVVLMQFLLDVKNLVS
jgi:hypothetical protein